MVVPELPDDLWRKIVCRGGVHANLIGLTRCTRDVALELIGSIYKLNRLQALAFAKVVYLGQNVFVHGGAGTGKSHCSMTIVDRMCRTHRANQAEIGIVAPTGAAARVASTTLVTAATLHRFFQIRRVKRSPDSRKARAPQEPSKQPTQQHALAILGASTDADVESQPCDGLETAIVDERMRAKLCSLRLLWIDEIYMIDKQML